MKNKYPFRKISPQRTFQGSFTVYRRYKQYLIKDFNGRCGYTDTPDYWFGGSRCFQIDHFKPVSKYPLLVTSYSNLVYCCSYINRAKSNQEGLFIDPCDEDYNKHFFRDKNGNICAEASSEAAKFMCKVLGLSLRRYGLIWQLEQLREAHYKLREKLKKVKENSPEKYKLMEKSMEVNDKFQDYFKYLGCNL